MSDNAEVLARLEEISARLAKVEAELAGLRENREVPEDVVMAISAAVAAYMGHRAKVKAVRFHRQGAWTAQGRSFVQSRSVPHVH